MTEPIIIYEDGGERVGDSSEIYEPFPEGCTDDSRELQGV